MLRAVQRAVEQTKKELGSIDRVTNAAATMPLGLLVHQALEVILEIMAIDFGGLVHVTEAALPRLLARRQGEFVSFSSLLWPTLYFGAYSDLRPWSHGDASTIEQLSPRSIDLYANVTPLDRVILDVH